MSRPATRFAGLKPWVARRLLAGLGLLLVLGLVAGTARGPVLVGADRSDAALYRAIAARTAGGGATAAAYYAVAATEQRTRGYPLRPFVTMREPALALLAARAGSDRLARAYRLLALIAVGLLVWRFGEADARGVRLGGAALATVSIMTLAQPALAVWHEAWAAMLLVPAVALAGRRGWGLACLAGFAAVLMREIAASVLVVLLVAAIAERRRAEAIGWAATLVVFAALFALHARHVAAVTLPTDPASPGWTKVGGWGFILSMMRHGSVLALLPGWAVAIAVPVALFGWAGGGGRFADRVALALAALIVPFMIVGRPDNFYWGLTIAPLLPVGLAFAPRALRDLLRSARQAGRSASWNAPWTADASS